jgi:hypothetical protein
VFITAGPSTKLGTWGGVKGISGTSKQKMWFSGLGETNWQPFEAFSFFFRKRQFFGGLPGVVIYRAFFYFLLHNHIINIKKKSFSGEVKEVPPDGSCRVYRWH